ncbi:Ulp1 protease family protein [Raphanus sativus]|nr:Ulp1 protease family protein [Raphanus sativus]
MNVVEKVATWSDEDKTRYAYLCILAIVIKGRNHKTKLRKRARMVFDLPKFEGYPWGRLAFKTLIKSVKKANLEGDSITVHGFIQVLQIWIYNLFPNFGKQFGDPSANISRPLLKFKGKKWYGRRNIDQILINDEVNIQNAFIKSEPIVWDDDCEDNKIDSLVQAICKEGGLRAVTWVEQGFKSVDKGNNTAPKPPEDSEERNHEVTVPPEQKQQERGPEQEVNAQNDLEELRKATDIRFEELKAIFEDKIGKLEARFAAFQKAVSKNQSYPSNSASGLRTTRRIFLSPTYPEGVLVVWKSESQLPVWRLPLSPVEPQRVLMLWEGEMRAANVSPTNPQRHLVVW